MNAAPVFTDVQKIEALALWELEGWGTSNASRELDIHRTTLLGWRSKKEVLSARVDAGEVVHPGPQPLTHEYEKDIVTTIKLSSDIDAKMTRRAILELCATRIPKFKDLDLDEEAQRLWLFRFLRRHDLLNFVAPHDFLGASRAENPQPREQQKLASEEPSNIGETSDDMLQMECDDDKGATQRSLSPLPMPSHFFDLSAPQHNAPPVPEIISLLESDSKCDNSEEFVVASQAVCETQTTSFAPGMHTLRLIVRQKDVDTLEPEEWLNDTIITYYIREHISVPARTYIMDSNLFGNLFAAYKNMGRHMRPAHPTVCGITATFPYDNFDYLIVPICMGFHWTFAVVQNPVLASVGLRRCMVHVDSFGLSRLETVKNVLCVYFDEEMKIKFPTRKITEFGVRGINTSPMQKNTVDSGIFAIYFMGRVADALMTGKVRLLSDIEKICTAPRSARFSPLMLRKRIKKLLTSTTAV